MASVECKSVGDAHAVVVACGHAAQAQKMDRSLRHELQKTVVIPGDAPDRFAKIHDHIMRHTLLRCAEQIRNDPDVERSTLDRLDKEAAAVADFLKLFNGDWSSAWPIHYCNGCHGSKEEVINHMHACCCEIDLMCA